MRLPFTLSSLRSLLFVASLSALIGAGCGDDDEAPPMPTMDGGVDAGPGYDGAPDGARTCMTDVDCDDHVSCTRDSCHPTLKYCLNDLDHGVCDDGVFCNGMELCDSIRGCSAGPPESCNDDDVCTIDRCDEPTKACQHAPRDFDGDGDADWHCEGGTDCDDRDPTRSALSAEICADGIDNDCDELLDESDCGRPAHDTCDDALDVSAGGLFTVSTGGATPDYTVGCGSGTARDVVLTFTLAEPRDVDIEASADSFVVTLALRSTCADRSSEIECQSGFPGQIRRRSLPAGTYFVIVAGTGTGPIDVQVAFDPATSAPTNESCAAPLDVSAGGRFEGSFVDVRDDVTTNCGFSGSPDLVYSFTTTTPRDVAISAVSATGESLTIGIESTCGVDSTTLRCTAGSPARARLHELPPGTYFVILEGPSYREVDFTLDVEFLEPTPAPAGDTCAAAIPVTLGAPTTGTLSDKEDDVDISCGFHNRDAVYAFTLTDRADVTVVADADTTYMNASVRSTCADGATQLRCTSGAPARSRMRNLGAGTYYVIVESFTGTSFTLTVTASPPTVPIAVSGNDTCGTAYDVPVTGGLFTGDTSLASPDLETLMCGSEARSQDVAFRVVLPTSKRLLASTDGSTFDTVLHIHQTACMTRGEEVCDDDGGEGVTSLIDRVLAPGTYFIIVDGFGTSSSGAYILEVVVSDP